MNLAIFAERPIRLNADGSLPDAERWRLIRAMREPDAGDGAATTSVAAAGGSGFVGGFTSARPALPPHDQVKSCEACGAVLAPSGFCPRCWLECQPRGV